MQAAPEETTDAQDRADGEDETLKQADSSSILVSALVIVSRITGFFRTTMQAWALGATGVASAYTVANQMPNFLYELVVGGMLITSFLPVYINVKTKLGKKGAAVYASNLLTIVLVLMALLALISVALAAPIIWTQSAGASAGFDFDLSVWFFRWFAVSIVLYALSSIFSGVLNAERDYLWSNFAPVLNNLITIAMFVAYGYLVQDGADARGAAIVLAVGTPLAVAVQVFCQVPALRRHGLRLSLRVNLHDPALKDTLSIGLPTLVATLAAAPTTAIMSSCALSVTPAGASIAYYSRVWYVLPYSIFAIPITVTMFTELSSSFLAGRTDRFRDYVVEGTKKILFTLVPCAMLLIVFAEPLIAVFASGQFTDEDALLTAHYLQALSLALPLYDDANGALRGRHRSGVGAAGGHLPVAHARLGPLCGARVVVVLLRRHRRGDAPAGARQARGPAHALGVRLRGAGACPGRARLPRGRGHSRGAHARLRPVPRRRARTSLRRSRRLPRARGHLRRCHPPRHLRRAAVRRAVL